MTKIVKMDGNVVREVVPEYALPVEKFYGAAFAAQCVEAPDEVCQRWILNEDGSWTNPENVVEPEAESTIPIEDRVLNLEEQLAETDEVAIELYEASLAQEAINAEQDEAIIEIYEMIGSVTNG